MAQGVGASAKIAGMDENRRKLQFGLGSLFALTAIAAVGLAVGNWVTWPVVAEISLVAVGLFAMLIPMTIILLVIDLASRVVRFVGKCLPKASAKTSRP